MLISRSGNRYTVLTANHVACDRIPRDEAIACRADITYTVHIKSSGAEYAVTSVHPLQQTFAEPDLALVTFESDREYEVATLGDSESIALAADIHVAGYPAAFGASGRDRDFFFSSGPVVSQRERAIGGYTLVYGAETKVGMSGGPVFDTDGRVVGIHGLADAAILGQVESAEEAAAKSGFNAAIPINAFVELHDRVGLPSGELMVDSRPPKEKPARIDNPRNARDYCTRGKVRLYNKDRFGSLGDFERCIALDPKGEEATFARVQQGNAHFLGGNYSQAVEEYTAAIAIDEKSGLAYASRAIARARMGDYRGALADFSKAFDDLGYYDAIAYYNRGLAYKRLEEVEKALEDYERAIELDPNFALAYNALGILHADAGDGQAALEDYERAIELDPNFADAYNNRAAILNQQANQQKNQGDIEGAIVSITSAIADLERAAALLLDRERFGQHQQVVFNLQTLKENLKILQRVQSRARSRS